ncbi:hypothetical protein FRC01_002336 [Tulasnella sp. 417]|nr:hypothetical protein FRC01_002336 [Tulasnella sp. 417]
MSSITNLPKEIVLEITGLSTLNDAMNLLRCSTRLLALDHFGWTNSDAYILRNMATRPYELEQIIIKRRLRNVSPSRSKPNLRAKFADAKMVSGGQWLVTLSTERTRQQGSGTLEQAFVRLWQITSPIQKNLKCVASMELLADHTPLEAYLQPGDGSLDLLVFVNVYNTAIPETGGYIQVLRIDLAVEGPEFSLLTQLKTDRFCSGMNVQDGSVVAGFYVPGVERARPMIWSWKNGERLDESRPELGGTGWFTIVSENLYVLWNANSRSIDVHWSSNSDRPGSVDHHLPGTSDAFPNPPQGVQALLPVLNECRNTSGDVSHAILTHLEQETLRTDIESLGTGRISFTRYAKDNKYMQNPSNPSDPFGNELEAPFDFSQTVNGHLLDMSSSGRLSVYFTSHSAENTKTGESMSYQAFTDFSDRASKIRFPLLCPFSGVVGTVSQGGDFCIWRME